jgi:uncharacterized protein involved in exopolysaccharide biosynthesis
MKSPQIDETMPPVTLRDILMPLFRRQRLMMFVFCGILLCGILVAWFWAARYYEASMQIVVEQDRSDPAITAGQSAAVPTTKSVALDQVNLEVALLQGQDLLRSVAASCKLLPDHWSIGDIFLPSDPARREAIQLERAAMGLSKSIKVEARTTSDVIDVKFGRTGDPEVPACVLQHLSAGYLAKHVRLLRPPGSADLFGREAEEERVALAAAEKQLVDFSKKGEVGAPDILRNFMAQQIAASEASLYQARQAIAADDQRLQNIKSQLSTVPARSMTSEVSNSSNLLMQQLQSSLLAAQLKRSQLLLKYEPSYPLVREADEEVEQTQQAIRQARDSKYVDQTTDRDPTYEFLRQDEAKTEADLASEKATLRAVGNSVRDMRVQAANLDGRSVEQAALIREVKAKEGNYLLYLSKREQERVSDALDQKKIANVAIAVPPVVPLLPAHSPMSIVMVSAILALLLSLLAAFVAEYLDPSFRTPQEVIESLNIPVVASLPRQAA